MGAVCAKKGGAAEGADAGGAATSKKDGGGAAANGTNGAAAKANGTGKSRDFSVVFKQFDTDNSGSLDMRELKRALKALGRGGGRDWRDSAGSCSRTGLEGYVVGEEGVVGKVGVVQERVLKAMLGRRRAGVDIVVCSDDEES